MKYNLDISASDDTSNLNHLLDPDLREMLSLLTPSSVEAVFGPGDDLCYEPERGYDAPEWYWQSSDGCVWGIGWRWGSPRLRGRGGGRTRESAAAFVTFLVETIHRNAP